MKTVHPLKYYINKLASGERFSLARYGDGELLCMWGRHGGNSHGCRYSEELREGLWKSLKHKDDRHFIYGLQRVLPRDEERVMHDEATKSVNWHDTEIFSEAVADGELGPFIEELKKHRTILVGNERLAPVLKVFGGAGLIPTPFTNSYDKRDDIKAMIKLMDKPGTVFLFAAGMGAKAIIGELHGKIKGTMFDVGHIWDPFIGDMSRCDLEGKTLEDINKNLYATAE
jgi:hypothetical protein